ncbi:MAG: hypothetical protein LBK71_02700, partial [Verrucomicrobiales bacterium]|nr:hypothetical protein [Verrucomicrobiales bacterium]
GERDWEYRCEFDADRGLLARRCVDLVAEGLDTIVSVALNGREILRGENMFHTYRVAVKKLLRPRGNTLTVQFASAEQFVRTHRRNFTPQEFNDPVGGCVRIRKQQCQFGWDWGPRLVTAGVWRPIYLAGHDGVRIESVRVAQRHADGRVTLTLTPELSKKLPAGWSWSAALELDGAPVARADTLTLTVRNPRLWWPRGHGEQPLYTLTVTLRDADGQPAGHWQRRIGLRTLRLNQARDEFGKKFQFEINGRPIFCKGANWIPAHSFVGGLRDADYDNLLRSAAAAHMNTIRVWGGGVYEPDYFYDRCDELGLLVWQDFMFACTLYPGDAKFLRLVRTEAEQQVRRLRHHACLLLWCGNNEIALMNRAALTARKFAEPYQAIFRKILPLTVAQIDGVTPYWETSPGWTRQHRGRPFGDAHDWEVWFKGVPAERYLAKRHRFLSEFGMQSFPSLTVAESFCPPEELNAFSATFETHQKCKAAGQTVSGSQMIFHYILERYRLPGDYRAAAYLSQLNQAHCLKVGIEHFRRLQPRCMGTLYWQLNDCWPAVSWSSIEFGGGWKALHFAAKKFFNPLLVSVVRRGADGAGRGNYYRNTFTGAELHVSNDGPLTLRGRLRWRLCRLDGAVLADGEKKVTVSGGGSRRVALVKLPPAADKRDLYLGAELLGADGVVVSEQTEFFVPPKYLPLQRAVTRAKWRQLTDRDYELTLRSSAFQHAVQLSLPVPGAVFADNFFDLPTGEERRVMVSVGGAVPVAELRQQLTVYSLRDTY